MFSRRSKQPRWWIRWGPGVITGMADDDPSGIATYSQAGAQFGYSLAWTVLFTYPLMAAIQLACARIGRITGRGLVDHFTQAYPRWVVWTLVLLLTIANVINLGADIHAMADVTVAAVGAGNRTWVAVAYGLGSLVLLVYLPYDRYVMVLKWLTVSVVAYVGVACVVDVDWSTALWALVWPKWHWDKDWIVTTVAILGTTITPSLFFWQASQEVEEIRRVPGKTPLARAPHQVDEGLSEIRWDTWIGMGISNLIAYFMLVAAAATLHVQGIEHIATTAQAAQALAPIAGRMAYLCFACGMVGTGLLALPVLAGSMAYGVASLLGARQGLYHPPGQAKVFYAVLAVAMALGVVTSFWLTNPIEALYWAAVINAVVAVPCMVAVMCLASNPQAMHGLVLPRSVQWLGWLSTVVMGSATLAMLLAWML